MAGLSNLMLRRCCLSVRMRLERELCQEQSSLTPVTSEYQELHLAEAQTRQMDEQGQPSELCRGQ